MSPLSSSHGATVCADVPHQVLTTSDYKRKFKSLTTLKDDALQKAIGENLDAVARIALVLEYMQMDTLQRISRLRVIGCLGRCEKSSRQQHFRSNANTTPGRLTTEQTPTKLSSAQTPKHGKRPTTTGRRPSSRSASKPGRTRSRTR